MADRAELLSAFTSLSEGDRKALLLEKVKRVKAIVKDRIGYVAPTMYDIWIERFLLVRKLDEERACKMINNFVELYHIVPSLVHEIDPDKQLSLFEERFTFFLKQRDKEGRRVLVFRLTEHTLDNPDSTLATFLMVASDAGFHPEDLLNGITIILDLRGWNLDYTTRFATLARLRAVLAIYQDAFPIHISQAFIFNNPYVFKAVWKVCCLFLSDKNRRKIQLEGGDFSKATELVGRENLPEFLGGDVGEQDLEKCVDSDCLERILGRDKELYKCIEREAQIYLKCKSGRTKEIKTKKTCG